MIMKKLFLLLTLFGVFAVGCENLFPNEPESTPNAIFNTDSNGAYIIEVAGGEVVVTIKTNVDYSIVIPEEAKSWLSVADTRAEARMEKQTFIIAENDTLETRLANVEFVDGDGKVLKSILFSQKGEDKVFATDAEGNYIVIAEGGEVQVAVTTNLEYSVAIPEAAQEWLSVADTRVEIREETLTFIAAENETFEERSTNVELLDNAGVVLQTITFVQRGQTKVFENDGKNSYAVDAVGGKVNIVVTTNLEYNINIAEDAQEWLSVADTRVEIREETLTFIVAENKESEERSANVELVDNTGEVLQTISFIQSAAALPDPLCPSNEIWYTSADGNIVEPYSGEGSQDNFTVFGANIVSNKYDADKDCWVIRFDGDVTTIGDYVFSECYNLTSVTIGDGVTIIGEYAFSDCWSLTSIIIPDSVTTIGDYAFYDCGSLTSITIPDSVTTIGDYAFRSCSSLTSVTIPDGVTSIGSSTFDGCRSLTSITIPDSVTTIGEDAFHGCSSLTSVTIPDSVTTIGYAAFSGCSSLTIFNGKYASEDGRCLIVDGTLNSFAPAGLTEYNIPDSVTTIGYCAFIGCSSLTSVTIGDSVTTIGYSAFYDCGSLTSVTIPDSVTTIGIYTFYNCRSLTSVTIPDSVTSIENSVFYGCSSLTSVTIPDSVTTIGDEAFKDCRSLTSVTIPDSVTTIGGSAFYNCSSLTSVYCKATTPPAGGSYMFSFNASGRKIYVPMESVEAYKSASYWSSCKNDIVGYDF